MKNEYQEHPQSDQAEVQPVAEQKDPKAEAFQTIINAINVAQKRGAFDLKESAIIYGAVAMFEVTTV